MTERSTWVERLGGAAGVAFVVLFLASPFFGGSSFPGPDQTGEAIARDLADNRYGGLGINVVLVGLASVAGFWFVSAVHQRLNKTSSSTAGWAALAGGVATMTLVLIGSGILRAAITVESLVGDPQVAKTLWLLEHGFFDALIAPPLVAFILGVSVHTMQHRSLPRWVGWTGLVMAAALTVNILLGFGGLAAAGGFIWMLAVAIYITVRPTPTGA